MRKTTPARRSLKVFLNSPHVLRLTLIIWAAMRRAIYTPPVFASKRNWHPTGRRGKSYSIPHVPLYTLRLTQKLSKTYRPPRRGNNFATPNCANCVAHCFINYGGHCWEPGIIPRFTARGRGRDGIADGETDKQMDRQMDRYFYRGMAHHKKTF